MNKTLNLQGCKNLINGILTQAANDYIRAVVSGKKSTEKEAGSFLDLSVKGRYIKKKCLEEIKICKEYVNNFLESDSDKILIDESAISVPVLRTVVLAQYKEKAKVNKIDDCKVYLIRK